MDIKVGATAPAGPRGDSRTGSVPHVEARLLAVRAPRRRVVGPPTGNDRRESEAERPDPIGGKVLVLLIPDGSRLPADLESGQYRLFLRFARR